MYITILKGIMLSSNDSNILDPSKGIIGKRLNIIISLLYLLNINIIYNKFLLERYLYKPNFKKVKYIKSIKQIYKNRINFINNSNEIKVLEKIFK